MKYRVLPALVLAALGALAAPRAALAAADALDAVRDRGVLGCAVSNDEDDFSQFDAHGNVSAFGADLCRAVAAAIFPGGHAKVRIDTTGDEITAVRAVADGHDDLAFGTTPDPAIAVGLHVAYAPPFLIDGEGFLVNRGENIRAVAGLAGKRVCFVEGTPEAETVKTGLAARHVPFTPFPFSERGEMMGALATGHCDAVTGDVTELAAERLTLPALQRNGAILADTITTDPWSVVVRADAVRLLAVVVALQDGLVTAAERGVTRDDAARLRQRAEDPVVRRLLGADDWVGRAIGLDREFLLRALATSGNQAELFARDLGDPSPLRLPRGSNRPVASGGALISIPVGGGR